MEMVKRKRYSVIGRCEDCGQEIEVPLENLVRPHMPSVELKSAVQCACGEYHNLIAPPESYQPRAAQIDEPKDAPLRCPRCRSTQLHAGDKGFSLGKAVAGGVLIGPVGLLGGLLGSKKTIITCLECGFKWRAGKR